MTVQIPPLPTPVPQSTDPVNFAARADAFLSSLVPFADAANRQNVENNQLNTDINTAAASARVAALSANNSADVAAAGVGAGLWLATTTYAIGNQAWSPVTGLIYRRLIAGRTAVDPSVDRVNWVEVRNLPVGSKPNQVPAVQDLGALAFMDVLAATQASQHVRDSKPGDVWHEWVSDTQLVKKFHGFDNQIRSITETYA